MKLTNFTIHKVFPLQQGVNSQGESWESREIILKDETHEYGDTILCRLRGERAANFEFLQGDLVDAQVDFRVREYMGRDEQLHPSMEARCWKLEPAQPTC